MIRLGALILLLAVAQKADEVLVFERAWEPREKAFSILVPKGWKTEGGVFRVDPSEAGGPGNSMFAKNQFLVKRDDAISVGVLFMPNVSYAELGNAPAAGMFPQGSNYQGMEVKRLPAVHDYLMGLFKVVHQDKATAVKVLDKASLPELKSAYDRGLAATNRTLRMAGLSPITASAGALAVEYTEGGVRYWEVLLAALVDMRASALSWSNDQTVVMRAPAKEVERWKPVLQIIWKSVEVNPTWWASECRGAAERAEIVDAVTKEVRRIDREIHESRAKTQGGIMRQNYLVLTGQSEFTNPFTKKKELDVSSYKRRWVTEGGDRLYTNNPQFDPNKSGKHSSKTWKLTKAAGE